MTQIPQACPGQEKGSSSYHFMLKTTQESDDVVMILGESEDQQWSRWAPGTSGHLRTESYPCFVPAINHVFLIVLSGNTAKTIFSLRSSELIAGAVLWTLWEALGGGWCINKEAFPFQERLIEFTFLKCSANYEETGSWTERGTEGNREGERGK